MLLCLFLALLLAAVGGWKMRDPRTPGRHTAAHFARQAPEPEPHPEIVPGLEVATS